jgi:uncharacterized protein with HEPN domain
MLRAAEDAGEYVALPRDQYLAEDRLGRFARRGLRNCVFEFCESGTRLSQRFRDSNLLRWTEIFQMRQDLGHDYPEVPPGTTRDFAREFLLPSARKLRRPRFPKPTAPASPDGGGKPVRGRENSSD